MFDGGEHGDRSPVTPMAYSPASPMSTGINSEATEQPKDLEPIMNLLAAGEEICEALRCVDEEIIMIIKQLGGNEKSYRRERAKQTKFLVSEIYSTPRITRAL